MGPEEPRRANELKSASMLPADEHAHLVRHTGSGTAELSFRPSGQTCEANLSTRFAQPKGANVMPSSHGTFQVRALRDSIQGPP